MAMVLYINIHHFIMIEKLQDEEKKHWALLELQLPT
jgi:hypothetical protein